MLWALFLILLIGWIFGMVSSNTLGGYIHLLLIVAIIVLIYQVVAHRMHDSRG